MSPEPIPVGTPDQLARMMAELRGMIESAIRCGLATDALVSYRPGQELSLRARHGATGGPTPEPMAPPSEPRTCQASETPPPMEPVRPRVRHLATPRDLIISLARSRGDCPFNLKAVAFVLGWGLSPLGRSADVQEVLHDLVREKILTVDVGGPDGTDVIFYAGPDLDLA